MNETPVSGAVAVIVVSGVGNERPGSGRDAIVETLMADPERRWVSATPGTVTLTAIAEAGAVDPADPAAGPLRTGTSDEHREVFDVATADVTARADQTAVDVYEMYWADLSRAQGAFSRVFYLLMGITLQLSTIGLEAVRRFRELGGDTPGLARLQRLMNVMSYWMVYAVTPVTITMVTLLFILNAQLLAPQVPDVVSVWLVGGVGAAAAAWIAGRIVRGGWTFLDATPDQPGRAGTSRQTWLVIGTLTVAIAAFVLALASTSYREFGYTAAAGSATLAVALVVDLLLSPRRGAVDLAGRIVAVRIGFALGPVLAAAAATSTAGPIRTADVLAAVSLRLDRLMWLVLLAGCLVVAVLALIIRHAAGVGDDRSERRRLSMSVVVTLVLGPVLFSVVTTGIFVFFSFLSRVWPGGYPTCWDARSVSVDANGAAQCGSLAAPHAPAGGIFTTPDIAAAPITHPVAWGNTMIREMAQPLGISLLFGGLLLVLILAAAAPYVASLARGGSLRPGTPPFTATQADISRARSEHQGRRFDRLLRQAGSDGGFAAFSVGWTGVTLAAALSYWVFAWTWGSAFGVSVDELARDIGYWVVLGVVVVAAAAVGFKNVGVLRFVGRPLAVGMTAALDLVYDISSYLRIGQPGIVAPRIKMAARYRALLTHLHDAGYGRVVVCAHSQGTQLTYATLVGDRDRRPPLAGAVVVPDHIEVVTYGSPLTQTYRRRLPRQFGPLGPPLPLRQLMRQVNIYRAGDYIGRALQTDRYDPTHPTVDGIFMERCLGTGQHTAYGRDERWRRVIRWVITTPASAAPADAERQGFVGMS